MILDDFGLIKLLSWPSQDWEIHVHHFKIVLAIIFFRTNPLVSSQCSKALTEVDEKWLLRTSKQMKDHINSYRQDSPYKFCISIIHSPPKQVYICLMHVQATIGVSHGTAEFSNSWHLPSQSDSCRCMCICNIYILYIYTCWKWKGGAHTLPTNNLLQTHHWKKNNKTSNMYSPFPLSYSFAILSISNLGMGPKPVPLLPIYIHHQKHSQKKNYSWWPSG
jgi:hypothetical protein